MKKEFFKKHQVNGDGWCYRFGFYGDSDEDALDKLKNFLLEEGFNDVPIPPTARRLWWDYLKPDQDGKCPGYVWHPIRIFQDSYQMNGLVLMIFNEDCPDHMAMWEETFGDNE